MNKNQWIDRSLLAALAAEATNAHRLCTTDNGWVERFDQDVLISYRDDTEREQFMNQLERCRDRLGFEVARVFGRFLPKKNEERAAPRLLAGDNTRELRTIATERGLKYGIDFTAGYSPGLFLDQRENRTHVRKIAAARLLNCFAYTCSFSVAAASVGTQTVNVDLSKKWLTRGKENFELNGLDVSGHRFIDDDVRPVLRRLAQRGERFDLIILDPPTFAHSLRRKTFRLDAQLEELVLSSVAVADGKGHILISSNCATLRDGALKALARRCLKRANRAGTFHLTPIPADFPADSCASTMWLSLD